MKILLTILCIVISCHSFAQKAPIKFGEIPLEDMKMEQYKLDSSASAVVLADFGESTLKYSQNTGFSVLFERTLRIKILTKDGLDWATVSIPLYHDGSTDEKISTLRASTFNLENGKIAETKMKGDATFKEKVNENLDLTKFTLPNVRQGSIIEVSYKVMSDFLFNFQDWEFQRTIPTRWSEYRTAIPEYFHYEKYLQGYIHMDVAESKQESNQIMLTHKERESGRYNTKSTTEHEQLNFMEQRDRWVAKNVPAFKAEPYMTTYKDYISRMNFELAYQKFPNQPLKPFMGTWDDINKQYYENSHVGSEVTGNGFLRKIVEELTAGQTTPEAKIAAINNYVKKNVEWNGRSLKYTENSLKSVLEDRKGSSAEVNLLLASMIDKAGFDVSPVLISTRDHGFVRETTPVSSQFNYVICGTQVGDKFVLLDATDPLLATGVLPERCLNGQGLVITKTAHRWVPLTPKMRSRNMYNADLVLNPQGELTGKLKFERSGYFALECRKNYLSKGEGEYMKGVVANRSWTVAKSEFMNTKDVSENFKEIHQVTITDHLSGASEVIYLNPFLDLQEKENPFKSPTREYPVDFGSPMEKLYMCKIAIPEGFVVDEIPQPKILKLGDNAAKYTYSVVQSGNMLNLTSHLVMNNSLFPQTEYSTLREFYDLVVAKQAEQIVLKKTK
ncbi:MAG TPA: transglutaminase domain-containing protein [Chryseolinea sp.]|nr:transglutaminase domain-containing protein [Chryseolinea sp.]